MKSLNSCSTGLLGEETTAGAAAGVDGAAESAVAALASAMFAALLMLGAGICQSQRPQHAACMSSLRRSKQILASRSSHGSAASHRCSVADALLLGPLDSNPARHFASHRESRMLRRSTRMLLAAPAITVRRQEAAQDEALAKGSGPARSTKMREKRSASKQGGCSACGAIGLAKAQISQRISIIRATAAASPAVYAETHKLTKRHSTPMVPS